MAWNREAFARLKDDLSSLFKPEKEGSRPLKRLSSEEVFHFFEQLRTLLQAGVTPYAALSVMVRDGGSKSLVPLMLVLQEQIAKGTPVSEAVRSSGVFPDYATELLVIGEQTGKLELVCGALSSYYEEEDDLKKQIRQALTYPLVMIVMIFVIILVLFVKVMPIFAQVFAQLGTSVSGIAATLMNVSQRLSRSYVVILIVFAVLALLFFGFTMTQRGQTALRSLLQRLPLTKGLMRDLALTRFANGMVLTSSAGLDPYTSLDLVSRTIENDEVLAKIEATRNHLQAGESFSEAIANVRLFNSFYSGMIAVFAGTGSVDRAMEFIASRYRQETDNRIGKMLSAIEPTMVAILSCVIGLILFSIILPLMAIMSNIG